MNPLPKNTETVLELKNPAARSKKKNKLVFVKLEGDVVWAKRVGHKTPAPYHKSLFKGNLTLV